MNKTNLSAWLAGLCAVLLLVLLVFQSNQKTQLDSLRQQQESFARATEQRQNDLMSASEKTAGILTESLRKQQEAADRLTNRFAAWESNVDNRLARNEGETRDSITQLKDQVLTLGTNWEAKLTSRLNAKSDEIIAAFSVRLNEQADKAATRVSDVIHLQTETTLKANSAELTASLSNLTTANSVIKGSLQRIESDLARDAGERSIKTAKLLESAIRYERDSKPELAELCYLSAFKCSAGHSGLILKPFLAWKERNLGGLNENDRLTKTPAMLMSLYETLDKVLPDSSATPEEMENALITADRMRKQIVDYQQAKIDSIQKTLSWGQFDTTKLTTYEGFKNTLVSFYPANETLEKSKADLQERAENLIQTAKAMNSQSAADIFPPSPKAPTQVLTNWLEHGLTLISSPTNTVEVRLAGLSVLMNFAGNQIEIPEFKRYAETLTNESVKLGCAQWNARVKEYEKSVDKMDKPDADTFAVGQSLLNQGFAVLQSFTNKTVTAEVSASLSGLASTLYVQKDELLHNEIRLVLAPDFVLSKEQMLRARSMVYGQVLNALFELRALEVAIKSESPSNPDALTILQSIESKFRNYLAACDKLEQADQDVDHSNQLSKQRQQLARYADYCQQEIDGAYQRYQAANKLAEGITHSWSDPAPQGWLNDGLRVLYGIDVNDLNRANPGIAAEWSRIEDLLKKNFKGVPSTINAATQKKSINDFQQ